MLVTKLASTTITLFYCLTIGSCSKLLKGGTIVFFDSQAGGLKVIRDGSILITGDSITSIFSTASPEGISPDTEVVDCANKIITPGFIDTHRHGWQTVFKTLGSNTTLAEYAFRYGASVAEPLFTPEDLYISQLTGIYEALAAGVTTTLDHAHHTWTAEHSEAGLNASIDSGARVFFAYTFQNSSATFGVPEQIAQWRELASKISSNLTKLAIAYDDWTGNPHGADTLSVIDLVLNGNASLLTAHSVEGAWSFGDPPEDLHKAGVLNISLPVVLSHTSYLTPRGAGLLRSTNQYISITPESEMHYGHLHPTSHLIMDQASLGVDTHFTFSTDILTQARLWLQSTRAVVFKETLDRWEVPGKSPFSVNQAFLLATRNGGLALGRSDLGVISENAKADLVVWDGRSPALLGWSDPVAAVILHASVGDIVHVLVNGEFKKRDGKLAIEGYAGIQDRFLESAGRIQAALKAIPGPPQDGDFLPGRHYGYVPQLDVQRGEGTGYGPSFV
ncbi:hypothetical protein HYFRA_00001699 [Hymenoscyphus fraxineus]|uniref:Amidohydrolase-related domain-containing protein n=1 Tax=Hymenoscyphus fraxineus TaxID=746836 RepID=A0A9N9L766_9HELO|nr:hypothetical protein HYFRA_00001699 [Hymenoscyphus fraxineus]